MQLTVFDFIEALLSMGVIFEGDSLESPVGRKSTSEGNETPATRKDAKNLNKLIRTICRATLFMPEMMNYRASEVAFACIHLSRRLFGIKTLWPQELVLLSTQNVSSVAPISEKILKRLRTFNLDGIEIKLDSVFPLLGKLPSKGAQLIRQEKQITNENMPVASSVKMLKMKSPMTESL